MRKTKPLIARIFDKVLIGDGCWQWTGFCMVNGYGKVWDGTASRLAHRVMYEFMVGPIPDGLQIDHLCRNRGCVRPDHLEPVSHGDNMRRGAPFNKSHCSNGHPRTDENTVVERSGWKKCKICSYARNRAYRKARREAKAQPPNSR